MSLLPNELVDFENCVSVCYYFGIDVKFACNFITHVVKWYVINT